MNHNVVVVREFDGVRVGSGLPGPVHCRLNALLVNDMLNNVEHLTPVTGL